MTTPPPKANLLAWIVPAAVLPAVGSVFYFFLTPGTRLSAIIYTATKLFTLVCPLAALALLRLRRPRLLAAAGQGWGPPLVWGLLSGLLIWALVGGAYAWSPLGDVVAAAAPQVRHKVSQLGVLEFYVPFSLFLALAHSLLEEFYWRWFVFGALTRVLAPVPAAMVGSAAFALHHYVVLAAYFPLWLAFLAGTGVAVGGLFWCWLYRRQETLLGAWISHALADAVILAIGYRLLF